MQITGAMPSDCLRAHLRALRDAREAYLVEVEQARRTINGADKALLDFDKRIDAFVAALCGIENFEKGGLT